MYSFFFFSMHYTSFPGPLIAFSIPSVSSPNSPHLPRSCTEVYTWVISFQRKRIDYPLNIASTACNAFLNCPDLCCQTNHSLNLLIQIQSHLPGIELFWIFLERNHSILLIDGGKNFAFFNLKKNLDKTRKRESISTIRKTRLSASTGDLNLVLVAISWRE